MKKFLVAIVAVLFAAPSFAQISSGGFSLTESTVYYGMRMGLNVANLTGDTEGFSGANAGLNLAGVWASVFLILRLSSWRVVCTSHSVVQRRTRTPMPT